MNKTLCGSLLLNVTLALAGVASAEPVVAPLADGSGSALTIYNQNFAVVREVLPLDLKPGLNRVAVSDMTALLEPDSVILRDMAGRTPLQIVEQAYRNDPVAQSLLLSKYEGRTIDFEVHRGDKTEIVKGKIIRSGYVPVPIGARPVGNGYYYDDTGNYITVSSSQPLIEVNGQLRFSLPGEPIFPSLPEDAVLKPTLDWVLRAQSGGPVSAEMAYVTGGMDWKADYNVIAPDENGKTDENLDLTGWVTLTNASGKTFDNARIKLMAGDISRVQQPGQGRASVTSSLRASPALQNLPANVTEKPFDDYHLYSLKENTTLRDRETKQVEFVRAAGVKSARIYVYDGLKIDSERYNGWDYNSLRNDQNFGTQSSTKVQIMRTFANTAANGLGIPLPKGRLRFYRREADGQLEFTGENVIDHTPQGEMVRVYTGNAFDLVGERKRTTYKSDQEQHIMDESFAVTVRNRKKEAAEVRIVEHMYRGDNWSIPLKSNAFVKQDANTIEFRVQLPPDGSQTVTYTVHYTW